MLQSMRHLAQSWYFKGLMLILMVSFGIWGIGADIFSGNSAARKVASVGDTSITMAELQHDFEQGLVRARQMFGPDLTAQQAKQMGLLDHTLDLMIQRAAIDQDVKKLGINVSDNLLVDHIAAQPQFRDKTGKFNTVLFRQLLAQAHVDEASFLSDGRKDLMRRQVLDLFETEATPPDFMVNALYHARAQKRIFEIVTLKNDAMTGIAAPDDKTLHDYYQANPQAFTAPEYRNITIARLAAEDTLNDTTISDDTLRKEYDIRSPLMMHPERRDIIQVVVQDENRAKLIAVAARGLHSLTGAAKEKGYDAVTIAGAEASSLPTELAQPVFAMEPGHISDPIKTSLGWHVVQLQKIIPAGKPDFDSVKNELRENIKRDQAADTVARSVNTLDDDLAAGHALEDIADSLKLRLIKLPPVDAEGKTADGKDPGELPNKDDVLRTAFGQGAGETSPVIDDKKGNYFVVRTDDVTPATLKPFEKVQPAVLAAWKAAEQSKQAHATAEKIAEGLRAGKAPAEFSSLGASSRMSKPVSALGDKDDELPANLLPQILKLNKGEVTTASLPDRQLVIRLHSYQDAGDPDVAAKGKLVTELKTDMGKDWTEEYINYLRSIFSVKIYDDALDTYRQQGG